LRSDDHGSFRNDIKGLLKARGELSDLPGAVRKCKIEDAALSSAAGRPKQRRGEGSSCDNSLSRETGSGIMTAADRRNQT
jgi:hypothetical protein